MNASSRSGIPTPLIELHDHAGSVAAAVSAPQDLQDAQTAHLPLPRSEKRPRFVGKLSRWCSLNLRLEFSHDDHDPSGTDPRDFLALERTYLAWFRTSVAVVSLGVGIAQLFILRNLDPNKGKIFGAIFSLGGICTSVVGCTRYFRQQTLLSRGKTLSGGYHVILMLCLLGAILLSLFVTVLVED